MQIANWGVFKTQDAFSERYSLFEIKSNLCEPIARASNYWV